MKALAGESYRDTVKQLETDYDFNDRIEAFVQEYDEATQWHLDHGVDDPKLAECMASIEMQDPLALHAYALRHGDGVLSREEVIEAAFGEEARRVVAEKQMQVDEKSARRVAKELAVANHIDVVIVDPFVATHSVNENDNMSIDTVARAWFDVARDGNCAVHLVHHSKKGERNDADAERARSSRTA